MGKPAARITDFHTCPMVTPGVPPIPHVGGPIIGPGCPTVFIGGLPAAVMGDNCICAGPPDVAILGSTGVYIGGKPALRMGDSTAHGGVIVGGFPTVLIGEVSSGAIISNEKPTTFEGKLVEASKKGQPFLATNKKLKKQKSLSQRSLEKKRKKAVREAWKAEKRLIQLTGEGSRNWTRKELNEILRNGNVKGYEGHHINSVKGNPEMAGDPNNIKFVKGRAEHLKEHGGNWSNETKGDLIDRDKLLKSHQRKKR